MAEPDCAMLPWSWYRDADVFDRELRTIFRRAWQYVGHVGELAEPGDYLTADLGDLPAVVVRGRDSELRAFANVCRHRGSVLVDGQGRRATLQCPYHAWTYDLDGSLRAAPRAEREGAFDASELSLAQLLLDTWGPFVFVNADRAAAPLEATLGRLPGLVTEAGIDVDALRFHSRSEYELDANWKIAVENYLECYHCPVAHAEFSDAIDVSPDSYVLEADGPLATQIAQPRTAADAEVARGQFHLLWPSLKINILPGRPNLSIGPVLPVSAERSAGFLDYFFAPDEDPRWIRDLLEFDDRVGREDAALVARVQRGVRSGIVEQGRLLPESEALIRHWQALVAAALASA